ncbi:MAG: hypothetical protein DRI69_06585 [Bacteroidetes bacterium]|nr:MAG: hypothetical protein DRI69_06585 [Bacteroidota bacterium]
MGLSQNLSPLDQNLRQGRLYIYWGWNIGWYTKSDITFSGDDYQFTLKKVIANDRQSPFALDPYLNPLAATIPQYNFRIGYFIKEHWDVSFGIDHMKYVVQTDQIVKISGYIENTETLYDGIYEDDDIVIAEDFLLFEHTDGLNYGNIEVRRSDQLFDFNKVKINLTEGLGGGMLIPRTNTTLLNKERYDEFHMSGFGLHGVVGINATFFNVFFIQSELRGGYINMPDIRTTISTNDSASQSFFFSQLNIVFGGLINLNKKTKADKK